MSVLRQLCAATWAAVWLRGRLLGLKLRRLFGGGRGAGAGHDHQRAAVEPPVEGVDYDPIELPADLAARLEAMRAELLDHARVTAARRRRPRGGRRRAASLAAALLGLGVLAAGASALVAGSTGVPVVDRLLGVYEQGLDDPGASERSGPSGSDLQPGPTEASEPIVVALADGSRVVTSFYVARDERICAATGAANGEGSAAPLACEPYPAIAANVALHGGYVPAIGTLGAQVIVRGYMSSRVTGLSGSGPYGPLDVALGKAWTPGVPGAEPLKPFVAVGPLGQTGVPDGAELQRSIELRNYAFDAMADGRRIRIAP